MTNFRFILILLAGLLADRASAWEPSPSFTSRSTADLEARLTTIDAELDQLAHYSLRSGMGTIGYRSDVVGPENRQEWVEVHFDRDYPIDEIVLIPCIRRDTEQGFQADAFPPAFRILVGTENDPQGKVVAEFDQSLDLLPRTAPVVAPLTGVSGSWVRIETTALSVRAFDGLHVLQLSELLVFSGEDNVALRAKVKSSSNVTDLTDSWSERFLVDGFMPYLMDSAQGNQSPAYVSPVGEKPALNIDLLTPTSISRIHLHAVDQSDTVPQAYAGNLGIPVHLVITGANQADFSDAKVLLDFHQKSINDTGPIMMWRIPETVCRFIRISESDPENGQNPAKFAYRIGFSEVELFSHGQNIALDKPVSAVEISPNPGRRLGALTDGNNLYGKILSIRTWLNELAQRHDLETERPLIARELRARYTKQKANLIRVSWLAGILAAGIGFTVLIDRNLRLRQVAQLKERFAADLHDELGANLHTIGILCDLAKETLNSPDKLVELLDRTRTFSERSGAAARHCTNMLEAKGLCEDLIDEIGRNSRRLLADLEYEYTYDGRSYLKKLKARRRIDLFLFHKECLTNVIRHSGATKVVTRLTADRRQVHLIVTDNGHGIKPPSPDGIPPSLKRRARLLGAKVIVAQPPDGGTEISLTLKTRTYFF